MKVLILEPYMTDSHRAWAEGIQQHSSHEVEVLGLPGVHWKWRMHGAAAHYADLLKREKPAGLLIVSDMLDLATFKGLLPVEWTSVPTVLYFHENQLTYPWSSVDKDPEAGRDLHYSWIHVTGCMAADEVWFNSSFHRTAFFQAVDQFLSRLPGPLPEDLLSAVKDKSQVLPIGIDSPVVSRKDRSKTDPPVILWNHRWEYDKGPETFFHALYELQEEEIPFELVVLGKGKDKADGIFMQAKEKLTDRILHWGYAKSKEDYFRWLTRSTVLPVTSRHDFLGISVLEAVSAGVQPLLPARLSYPELFGEDQACFYQSDEELFTKLKQLLAKPWQKNEVLAKVSKQYLWEEVITLYDVSISQIMLQNHHT